jgi:proteasome accessory factor B
MSRPTRVLSLLVTLMRAPRPVPWSSLRTLFPDDYGESVSDAAAERKFERDKAELLAMGVPLRFQLPDLDGEGGYFIDRKRLYLEPLALTKDQLALLSLIALSLLERRGFPLHAALLLALRKLLVASRGVDDPDALPSVRAVAARDLAEGR